MGGIRAAGDLVARMQLSKKMRIDEAKKYVADKLHVTPLDLSDPYTMRLLREELDIGTITGVPGVAKGIAAKARIAQAARHQDQLRRAVQEEDRYCTTESVRGRPAA